MVIHKEMFPVYCGTCLSHTAVRNWVRNTVKTLLFCGFRSTGKAMEQVYRCWCRMCREMHVFSKFEYHIFHVLYSFVIYLVTLPRIIKVMDRLYRMYRNEDD
jgi:hypothetical protein